MSISVLAYVATFSEHLHFWRNHFCTLQSIYVFKVASSTQPLHFGSSLLFRIAIFLEQLNIRNSYYFSEVIFSKKLLFQSKRSPKLLVEISQFFRSTTFLHQLLAPRTNLSRINIPKEELLFRSRYFHTQSSFSTVTVSTELFKNNFFFGKSQFFIKTKNSTIPAFSRDLLIQNSYILKRAFFPIVVSFSEDFLFHNIHF